ncbi:MAG: conjugal transfer protein TraG N-terminal domain-containing protein, partial [Methylophilus sp.]
AAIGKYILTSFVVITCLLGIRVPVAIIDMQDAAGAGVALTVDNVPLGNALPAALISGLGYGITQVFSDAFHMPNDLEYNKTGMIFGSRTWLTSTNARLSISPDLAADMSTYIRQCVFGAKLLASRQIKPDELVHSAELLKLYFDAPSPIYRVITQNGENISCVNAAKALKLALPKAADRELAHLSQFMTKGNKVKFNNTLTAAHEYFMGISTNAGAILTQNILINATRDAAADAFAFAGADAELMNYTNSGSMHKMHIAEANSFWLASYRLPYYMSVMWMLTICIFPLVILISLFPVTKNVYTFYLQSQAYLWTWPPLFIIIHFFVSLAASSTISIFGVKTGGLTFSNVDALASLHSNFAYTAGALAASVPFLAYYITKGLPSVLSNTAQHFGAMAQSLSTSEAQAIAPGNISMASYKGWNMNYDNTNANKSDTNHLHAEGRATVQTDNGAMLSEMSNGTRIGNVAPAISQAAVGVHGSDRVVDALHDSANTSFANAAQLRTAADTHIQAGLTEMSNFTNTDSNDYRSGEGLSNSTHDTYTADLRKMQDAVSHYNKHHDISGHVGVEGVASYRMSTDKALIGKGFQWVTGTSADVSVSAKAGASTNHSVQWFNNSSEGKAFNEAFSHMVSTAKNNHLDATDTNNLNKSEQIAANITKGQSLLEQSTSEYSRGVQLQHAASHASEHADNIDSNLNQAYHDWAVARHGGDAEDVMLKTATQSIATQNRWVNEFLETGVGKSAIATEVGSALKHTNQDVRRDYDAGAEKIKTANVSERYKEYGNDVQTKASHSGLSAMPSAQLANAKTLQQESRKTEVIGQSADISQKIVKQVNKNNINNKE